MARQLIDSMLPRSALVLLYPVVTEMSRLWGHRSRSAMVAVWHAERLLVVEHAYWRGLTLPGGHVHSNESPVLAACRELKEEVGIAASPTNFRPYIQMEMRHTQIVLFEYQLSQAPKIVIDNREIRSATFAQPAAISEPSLALRRYLRARRTA